MSRILVVDDDPEMRRLVRAYLQAAGHTVTLAPDGKAAASAASQEPPDLIVTDIQMPLLDGFGLFDAVRSDPRTARVPVVIMTAHDNREMLLKALRAGVDDFIGKPFDRVDLMNIVGERLKPPATGAPPSAVAAATAPPAPAAAPAAAAAPREVAVSVAACEVCGLEAFASVLNREELAELLAKLAADAEAAAQRAGGSLLRFAEERFAAIFPSDAGGTGPAHALKAIHGALTIVLAAQRLKPWTVSRFAGRDVPEVAVSVGIHLGTARLAPGRATGAVMDVASSLAQSGQALRWSIVASREAATAAGFAFVSGRSARVKVPKAKGKLAVVEIKGVEKSDRLAPDAAKVATLIGAAVDRNAGMLGFAQALTHARRLRAADVKAPSGAPPAPARQPGDLVEGYSAIRKLAENGIVSVFLAQPVAGGAPEVVKLILIGDPKKRPQLQRWVDAYAAVRSVDHPDVARATAQGLTATHVYLAQEYCPGGDLRNLIADGMSAEDAMKALLRLAAGLKAVHQKGVVHGDLKPANVMIRADGTFAITDFAVATIVEYAMGEAGTGVMVRSPDYLSPELVNGDPADMQTDVYTLGLLLYEMLTGQRPYMSADLSRVMMDHLSAPVPKLPAALERFQPLLDRLMAKNRKERFESVAEAIGFMAQENRPA